jgi:osmotically-inducible protein OsmY
VTAIQPICPGTRTAIALIAAEALGVPPDRVDVFVSDGWLALEGEVEEETASDAVFAAVSELPGVGGITNRIRVITAGIDG